MKTFIALTTAALVITVVSTATTTVRAQTPDPKKVEAGQKAFETQKCGTCHAIAGKGGKLAAPLDGVGKKLTEAEIKKWFTAPAEMEAKLPKKPAMPMSTYLKTHKLTDADVDGLVAYMLTLK